MHVVELASGVSPASSLDDPTGFIDGVVASIGVGLQDADVVFQVRLRVDAFAIRLECR